VLKKEMNEKQTVVLQPTFEGTYMTDHNRTPPPTTSASRRAMLILDTAIFSARWMIYPINVGLFLALTVYVYKFIAEVFTLMTHAAIFTSEEIMVSMLGLVDTALVATLLIMIIQGNHQIFIRRLEISDPRDRPQWLDHIDSGILKVKVALSIVGITLVQILKDFVNIEHVDWTTCVHRMYIHGLCLVSALVIAVIWRVTHPSTDSGSHNSAP
jgi:uncharacterized protein (TIGR00645 family)